MDTALKAIAEAAERGDRVPRVALLTGSATIFGVPISSTEYLIRARPNMAEAHMKGYRIRKRDRAEATRLAEGAVDEELRSYGNELGSSSGAISLGDVSFVIAATGEVVTPAVMRVPLQSVNAWFTGGFESKSPKGGGFAFFGASVPIGD